MKPKRLLIIDDLHPAFMEKLAGAAFQCDYLPEVTPEDVAKKLLAYDGLVLRSKLKIDRHLLQRATGLDLIARAGAGVDQIDHEALKASGITLLAAPEGNRDAVAEHTVGMLLSLLNRFPQADRDIRSGQWQREFFRGRELSQLTVGILGYGHMGQAFAKRLSSFGCKVLAYDPRPLQGQAENWASLVSLEALHKEADVLSIHFPLTQENENSINAKFLAPFQKKLILLNTARGKNLNLPEVYGLVKTGKITQLGLDVLPEEPPHGAFYEEMFADERVLFTPHVAGWTFASYRKISEVLAEKVLQFYREKAKN